MKVLLLLQYAMRDSRSFWNNSYFAESSKHNKKMFCLSKNVCIYFVIINILSCLPHFFLYIYPCTLNQSTRLNKKIPSSCDGLRWICFWPSSEQIIIKLWFCCLFVALSTLSLAIVCMQSMFREKSSSRYVLQNST